MDENEKQDILKVIEAVLNTEPDNDANDIIRLGITLMKAKKEIERLRAENAATTDLIAIMDDQANKMNAEIADLRDRLMRAMSGDPRQFGGF